MPRSLLGTSPNNRLIDVCFEMLLDILLGSASAIHFARARRPFLRLEARTLGRFKVLPVSHVEPKLHSSQSSGIIRVSFRLSVQNREIHASAEDPRVSISFHRSARRVPLAFILCLFYIYISTSSCARTMSFIHKIHLCACQTISRCSVLRTGFDLRDAATLQRAR